jgi:hypothetical protein
MVNAASTASRFQRRAFACHDHTAITRSALKRFSRLGLGYCWAQLLPHSLRLDAAQLLGPAPGAATVLALQAHWHKHATKYRCRPSGAGLHIERRWVTRATDVPLVLASAGFTPIGASSSNLSTLLDKITVLTGKRNFDEWAQALVNWCQVNKCAHVLRADWILDSPTDIQDNDRVKGAIKQTTNRQINAELLTLRPDDVNAGKPTAPAASDIATKSISTRRKGPGNTVSTPSFSLANALQSGVTALNYFNYLLGKYGQRTVLSAYTDMEKLIKVEIPGNSDPTPALMEINNTVTRMAQVGVPFPEALHSLFIIAKLPERYNVTRQLFAIAGSQAEDTSPAELMTLITNSWESSTSLKGKGKDRKDAHRATTVKAKPKGEPSWKQQRSDGPSSSKPQDKGKGKASSSQHKPKPDNDKKDNKSGCADGKKRGPRKPHSKHHAHVANEASVAIEVSGLAVAEPAPHAATTAVAWPRDLPGSSAALDFARAVGLDRTGDEFTRLHDIARTAIDHRTERLERAQRKPVNTATRDLRTRIAARAPTVATPEPRIAQVAARKASLIERLGDFAPTAQGHMDISGKIRPRERLDAVVLPNAPRPRKQTRDEIYVRASTEERQYGTMGYRKNGSVVHGKKCKCAGCNDDAWIYGHPDDDEDDLDLPEMLPPRKRTSPEPAAGPSTKRARVSPSPSVRETTPDAGDGDSHLCAGELSLGGSELGEYDDVDMMYVSPSLTSDDESNSLAVDP